MQEYASITSLVQEEMVAVHQAMVRAIDRIQPDIDYDEFLPPCRYGLLRVYLLDSGESKGPGGFSFSGWLGSLSLSPGVSRRCQAW